MPWRWLALVLLALTAPARAAAQPAADAPRLDVGYEGTPIRLVHRMLRLARIGASDTVVDLGCGDGRIPVTAAKDYGARGICVELDPERVREARENAARSGVADRLAIRQGDLFAADLDEASVVTLFLWPSVNRKLRPKLLGLAPGTRIVSLDHDMADWRADRVWPTGHDRLGPIFLWIVPARVAGDWRLAAGGRTVAVALRQTWQHFAGAAADGAASVRYGRLAGSEVRFEFADGRGGWRPLTGRVTADGRGMTGDGWSATRP